MRPVVFIVELALLAAQLPSFRFTQIRSRLTKVGMISCVELSDIFDSNETQVSSSITEEWQLSVVTRSA